MKIDWKHKLCSRKFWVAICGLVTSIVLIFGGTQSEAAQVSGVILQAGTVIAYCIGEGLVDSENVNTKEGE